MAVNHVMPDIRLHAEDLLRIAVLDDVALSPDGLRRLSRSAIATLSPIATTPPSSSIPSTAAHPGRHCRPDQGLGAALVSGWPATCIPLQSRRQYTGVAD